MTWFTFPATTAETTGAEFRDLTALIEQTFPHYALGLNEPHTKSLTHHNFRGSRPTIIFHAITDKDVGDFFYLASLNCGSENPFDEATQDKRYQMHVMVGATDPEVQRVAERKFMEMYHKVLKPATS